MKDFKGKVALITGGGSGIGKELALKLAKEQMTIVIASTNQEKLDAAAKEIKEAGAIEVLPIVCDVSVRDSVVNLHQEITKKFGRVDLLVCNAGVTTSGPFDQHRPEDWQWVYDVVLHGPVYCIQLFYPDMIEQKSGHIVIIGSQAGMVPTWVIQHGPYTSAKSAVMALGAALRPEAAEHNVGVTTVIVAGTITEIMKSERSRPERYGESLDIKLPKREARRIPASDVADMITVGIKENKEWVATHPDMKEKTKAYFDTILAAYDH